MSDDRRIYFADTTQTQINKLPLYSWTAPDACAFRYVSIEVTYAQSSTEVFGGQATVYPPAPVFASWDVQQQPIGEINGYFSGGADHQARILQYRRSIIDTGVTTPAPRRVTLWSASAFQAIIRTDTAPFQEAEEWMSPTDPQTGALLTFGVNAGQPMTLAGIVTSGVVNATNAKLLSPTKMAAGLMGGAVNVAQTIIPATGGVTIYLKQLLLTLGTPNAAYTFKTTPGGVTIAQVQSPAIAATIFPVNFDFEGYALPNGNGLTMTPIAGNGDAYYTLSYITA